MKLSKTIATILIVGLLSYACTAISGGSAKSVATSETAQAATEQDYQSALAAARAAQKKAGSVDGEWRDTSKLLKQAETAAKSGDHSKAVKLANKAKLQGEQGYRQALDQERAGPRF